MRFSRTTVAFGATLTLASARVAQAAQDVKVAVTTPATRTVWYADPFWLGVGAVAVILILLVAVAASKKGETKSTTTVIR
jgi:formate-dependent nitrite reductase membrane component NrfD